MDYRREIAEMLSKIQSEKILRYIYLMILDIPKRYWRQDMDYKKEIIEMIGKIENTCWLRSIYVFIRTLTTR